MNNIRFACRKCGQRLACEPPSLGTHIQCPACKQEILVPTMELLDSFQVLELGPRATLNEVRQAHLERLKLWHPDRFTNDPSGAKQAAEKSRELNRALEAIGAYYAGTYAPSRPAAITRAKDEPKPAEENRPRPAPEKRAEPKSPQPASSYPASVMRSPQSRVWLQWTLVGVGVLAVIALVVGLVIAVVQRQGPTLSDESTGSQWLKAKERAKREYSHNILVELEQKGTLRKTGLRVNDDFFYDGLESICRQKNPDDLGSSLLDLSTKLIATPPK